MGTNVDFLELGAVGDFDRQFLQIQAPTCFQFLEFLAVANGGGERRYFGLEQLDGLEFKKVAYFFRQTFHLRVPEFQGLQVPAVSQRGWQLADHAIIEVQFFQTGALADLLRQCP